MNSGFYLKKCRHTRSRNTAAPGGIFTATSWLTLVQKPVPWRSTMWIYVLGLVKKPSSFTAMDSTGSQKADPHGDMKRGADGLRRLSKTVGQHRLK